METYRSSKSALWVRFLAPHVMIFLAAVCLMAGAASAEEAEPAEVDQVTYYRLASVVDEDSGSSFFDSRAISTIPRLFESGYYGGTYLYSFWPSGGNSKQGTVKIGGYTFTEDSTSLLEAMRAVMVTQVNMVDYVDQAIEAAKVDTSALEALVSTSNTWLKQIEGHTDASTDHLGNIAKVLGWKNGQTGSIFETLQAISEILGKTTDVPGTSTVMGVLNGLDLMAEVRNNRLTTLNSKIDTLTANMNTGFGDVTTRQDTFSTWWTSSDWMSRSAVGGSTTLKAVTFKNLMEDVSNAATLSSFLGAGNGYLGWQGKEQTVGASGMWMPGMVSYGLLGLSANLAGQDKTAAISLLVPNSEGGLKTQAVSATNLLDMLGLIGTNLQNPLAKLAYVWADDDDIRIADKNQPVKDEIEEEFVGSGSAAVSVGNIKDVAGLSSGFTEAFSGDGKISDIFVVFADGESFGFFSQEVADALDTTASAAGLSDDPFDITDEFWVDETGIVHPKKNLLDVTEYLEGLK